MGTWPEIGLNRFKRIKCTFCQQYRMKDYENLFTIKSICISGVFSIQNPVEHITAQKMKKSFIENFIFSAVHQIKVLQKQFTTSTSKLQERLEKNGLSTLNLW